MARSSGISACSIRLHKQVQADCEGCSIVQLKTTQLCLEGLLATVTSNPLCTHGGWGAIHSVMTGSLADKSVYYKEWLKLKRVCVPELI